MIKSTILTTSFQRSINHMRTIFRKLLKCESRDTSHDFGHFLIYSRKYMPVNPQMKFFEKHINIFGGFYESNNFSYVSDCNRKYQTQEPNTKYYLYVTQIC